MAGRRIVYIALLAVAALYHFAYGQYATHYILIFFLCLPVLSVALSIPAAIKSRASLVGVSDTHRNGDGRVDLKLESRFFLPPGAWRITVEEQNLFTQKTFSKKKLRFDGANEIIKSFRPDTSCLGTIRYRIRKARVYDYLGLIPLPVKTGGAAELTVLPDVERPDPMPELNDPSNVVFRPMPQGFSEEHELRPYRGGDPLNLIHWKLSCKLDELIVREPQEAIRKTIVLSVDIPETYGEQQSVLEQLRCLNDDILAQELNYELIFGDKRLRITSEEEFYAFLKSKLNRPLHAEKANVTALGRDEIIYRIRPSKEVRQ